MGVSVTSRCLRGSHYRLAPPLKKTWGKEVFKDGSTGDLSSTEEVPWEPSDRTREKFPKTIFFEKYVIRINVKKRLDGGLFRVCTGICELISVESRLILLFGSRV